MSKLATSRRRRWRTTVAIFVLPLLLISLLRFFFCKEDPSVDGGDEQFQPVRLNEIFSMFRRPTNMSGCMPLLCCAITSAPLWPLRPTTSSTSSATPL